MKHINKLSIKEISSLNSDSSFTLVANKINELIDAVNELGNKIESNGVNGTSYKIKV